MNSIMTTLTIDNPQIEKKYTTKELEMKFLVFMQQEVKEDSIELYQISSSNLSKRSQNRLKKIDTLNFTNY